MDFFFHPRWPVFYEDNHLLVLYKPAGLIMQRDAPDKPNLVDLARIWLKERYSKPGRVFVGMVHRLDAPVAGVIVLARTSKSAARLSAQFRDNSIGKQYLAIVQRRPAQPEGRLVHRLERSGRFSRPAQTDSGEVREAALSYRLLDSGPFGSLLEILLETGRRHQIRTQLAAIGCPILGDRSYGADKPLPDGRIALLARRISFTHPTRSTDLTFQTPLPEGWPWPAGPGESERPLWTIEEYRHNGWVPPMMNSL